MANRDHLNLSYHLHLNYFGHRFIYLDFSDIQVSCFTYDGVEAVKKALKTGFECSSEELPIKVSSQLKK